MIVGSGLLTDGGDATLFRLWRDPTMQAPNMQGQEKGGGVRNAGAKHLN